ncbi:MAG: DMT family transporter [Pseudomonadota bacterium]
MNLLGNLQSGSSLRGIAAMLLAGIFLVTNDALTKHLVPHYPVGQLLFVQATIISLLASVWLRTSGQAVFAFSNLHGHLMRGLLYVVGSFCFVYALKYLPLGEVIAIAFAGPLFLTLFGKIFLSEQVGPHRIIAVCAGFVGVIIMMRPGSTMHWAVLLPLVVAIADAFRDIVTRKTTVGELSQRIVLSTAIVLALAGASTAIAGDWHSVEAYHLAIFSISACAFVAAHYFMVEAYRHAETVIVAPFRYVQLIWGILAGWWFFGEVLDAEIFIGSAVIIAAGLYIGWREWVNSI